MEQYLQDVRYAVRALRKRPGVTLLAVACLGIGIGASTAIFSPVDVFMFRPLPYPESDRLVAPYLTYPPRGWTELSYSLGDFRDHREMSRTLDFAAYDDWGYNLSGGDAPERLPGQRVSYNYFRVLGVPPAQGRSFLPDEERPGASNVVMLTHDLWMNRFGGDDVLGTTVRLDGAPHTIVGILPDGFTPPEPGPMLFTPLEIPDDPPRTSYFLDQVARLQPGATIASASAELAGIAARLAETHPEQNENVGAVVVTLWDDMFGRQFRDGSAIVSVAVVLLLLIAAANVANLLLARATDRGREMAVRTALGAGRRRIVAQLLTESVVLGLAGGVLGLALAWAGVRGLATLFPAWMPRVEEIGLDLRVIGFGVAVTLVAGVLSGLAPALQASKQDLRESLQEGGRGALVARHSGRLRNVFVTAQVAFALVLLVAAGLLVKGYVGMRTVPLGIEPAGVLSFAVVLPATKYPEWSDVRAAVPELERQFAAVPGVHEVGMTSTMPFSGNSSTSYQIEGQEEVENNRLSVAYRSVTPGFFDAAGMAIRRGRGFTAADDSGSTRVVVVNEAFVRRHWPDGDALGKRVVLGSGPREIVGVVEDTREFAFADPSPPAMLYLSAPQSPFRYLNVLLRTAGDPAALTAAARRAVLAMDPDQPIHDVQTLEDRWAVSLQADGIMSKIMIVLAGVALVLALVGVYGVMAYSVSQRVPEIGVRMALGADRGDVVGLVVRQGAKVVGIGSLVGLVLALLVSRGLAVFLYGVSAFDPVTFGVVVVALGSAAIVASWLPARRAARVDPIIALRGE